MSDERPALGRRIFGQVVALSTSPGGRAALTGVLGGTYLLIWGQVFLATWGTSLPVVAGLAAAMVLGCEIAWWRRARPQMTRTLAASGSFPWPRAATHLGLAAWTVALPWLMSAWTAGIGRIPVEVFARPAVTWTVLVGTGLVLLAVPAYLLATLAWPNWRGTHGGPQQEPSGAETLHAFLAGTAVGLLLAVFVVAPTAGLDLAASAAAVVGAAIAFVMLVRGEPQTAAAGLAPSSDGAPLAAEPVDEPHEVTTGAVSAGWIGNPFWAIAVCLVLGVFFAAGQRLTHQLMATAACTLCAQWAALLLGGAWGMRWARRRLSASSPAAWYDETASVDAPAAACLRTAAALAAISLGFGLLTDFVLLLNSHLASVWVMMGLRSLVAGLIVAPAGVCLGALLAYRLAIARQLAGASQGLSPSHPVGHPAAWFAAGFVLGRWLLEHAAEAGTLAVAAPVLLVVLGAARVLRDVLAARAWRVRIAVAAACVLPLAAIVFYRGEQPARATRLLFSTNVFLARQSGLNPRLLTAIDDGRLVALREGPHGTHTLWKLRGVQYHLRESGIPKGVVSSDARVCPHYPPEVMQCVLPLVLHERPARVLVLGLGSGVPLATCLRFPVLEVVSIEGDRALTGLLEQYVWPAGRTGSPSYGGGGSPFDDTRVRSLALDPVLAVSGRHRPYDVIVSNAGQSALPSAAACFTAEFYRHAARHLSADGIFCQRLQAIDYGAMPLAVLARTMQTAFRTVVFVETTGGEFTLLGTNSAQGLVRGGLAERLQTPHVRQVLAELGWDWSMVLNLPTWDHQNLAGFAAERGDEANTALSGRLAFRLPQEVIRWAPKRQEVQKRLGHRGTRFLEWENVDAEDPDLLRRLSEVVGQRNIMAGHPDEYWAYRRNVREQIVERPRAQIVPVKGDVQQRMHPIDQRRLDYFTALGEALRHQPPRADDIRHVAEYAVPFDPMLSFFLHQELAELYSRLAERDLEAEWPHRLHAIYYADAKDRSVRNVAAALVLLAGHSEIEPDPACRWDHLNGLLQMLQVRWQTRGAVPPNSSRIVLNDIEKSLAGVEAAFGAMDRLDAEHEIPHADWPARRMYLERTLLRPLRTYRSQVLPHHLKRTRLTEQTGQDADAL